MTGVVEPIRRTTLSGEVAERLSNLIRSGEWAAGVRIPSERDLGVRFGVGRTSIREALRMLQATGLVFVRPGDGVYVADPSAAAEAPFARWESRYHYSVQELFEARLAIEPVAAGQAALRATAKDVEAMAAAVVALQNAIERADLTAMVLSDSDFHTAITHASGNRLFQAMLSAVDHLLVESRRASLGAVERRPGVPARHRAIYDAIVAHDEERAAAAMRDHLLSFAVDMGVGHDVALGRKPSADGGTKTVSGV